MNTSPRTAHASSKDVSSGFTAHEEPEFDTERAIWDADYRSEVMERLRRWRLRHDALTNEAAKAA
jgi:hypothetical protein